MRTFCVATPVEAIFLASGSWGRNDTPTTHSCLPDRGVGLALLSSTLFLSTYQLLVRRADRCHHFALACSSCASPPSDLKPLSKFWTMHGCSILTIRSAGTLYLGAYDLPPASRVPDAIIDMGCLSPANLVEEQLACSSRGYVEHSLSYESMGCNPTASTAYSRFVDGHKKGLSFINPEGPLHCTCRRYHMRCNAGCVGGLHGMFQARTRQRRLAASPARETESSRSGALPTPPHRTGDASSPPTLTGCPSRHHCPPPPSCILQNRLPCGRSAPSFRRSRRPSADPRRQSLVDLAKPCRSSPPWCCSSIPPAALRRSTLPLPPTLMAL